MFAIRARRKTVSEKDFLDAVQKVRPAAVHVLLVRLKAVHSRDVNVPKTPVQQTWA